MILKFVAGVVFLALVSMIAIGVFSFLGMLALGIRARLGDKGALID